MEILNLEYHHKILIKKAINKTKNMREASKLLGLEQRTLYNWMKNLNIKREKKYGEVIQRS
jgi:hypothetical protein